MQTFSPPDNKQHCVDPQIRSKLVVLSHPSAPPKRVFLAQPNRTVLVYSSYLVPSRQVFHLWWSTFQLFHSYTLCTISCTVFPRQVTLHPTSPTISWRKALQSLKPTMWPLSKSLMWLYGCLTRQQGTLTHHWPSTNMPTERCGAYDGIMAGVWSVTLCDMICLNSICIDLWCQNANYFCSTA